MRHLILGILTCLVSGSTSAQTARAPDDSAVVRRELEARYRQNAEAYLRHDFAAIMALRHADFHSILPDGSTRDRAAMEQYIQGFLNGVQKWFGTTFTIDSLEVRGDTALAIVSQHADRMALRPDQSVRHLETWVTQRETWNRSTGQWLMWRVDELRNQRRLIDGKPG
jgi:ketosteroid isomerase-like protein